MAREGLRRKNPSYPKIEKAYNGKAWHLGELNFQDSVSEEDPWVLLVGPCV